MVMMTMTKSKKTGQLGGDLASLSFDQQPQPGSSWSQSSPVRLTVSQLGDTLAVDTGSTSVSSRYGGSVTPAFQPAITSTSTPAILRSRELAILLLVRLVLTIQPALTVRWQLGEWKLSDDGSCSADQRNWRSTTSGCLWFRCFYDVILVPYSTCSNTDILTFGWLHSTIAMTISDSRDEAPTTDLYKRRVPMSFSCSLLALTRPSQYLIVIVKRGLRDQEAESIRRRDCTTSVRQLR